MIIKLGKQKRINTKGGIMTIKGLENLESVLCEPVIDIVKMKELHENLSGRLRSYQRQDGINFSYETWSEYFERFVRPSAFIYVRHDVNSVSFQIQDGPIKENGKNGCQSIHLIAVAKLMIEGHNNNYPCAENIETIEYLSKALDAQEKRTKDR